MKLRTPQREEANMETAEGTPPAEAAPAETPAPGAEDEAAPVDSSVETEDLTLLVMMDAAAERPPGATRATIDGLQGDEISIAFEIPGAEPFKVSLPAQEVARRAAQISGEEPEPMDHEGGEMPPAEEPAH